MKVTVFIISIFLFVFCSFVNAEESINNINAEQERITQEISDNVMSPFCPGLTLSACPSPQAKDLKLEIKSWLEKGYSKEAVINQLTISYGEKISGLPRKSSAFGKISSFIPFIFLLLGIPIVIYTLKNMKKQN